MNWRAADLEEIVRRGHVRILEGPQPVLPEVSEKAFMQAVLRYARAQGWICYHTHDSRRSLPGFPDLVMVRNGICLFVECKVPGGALTLQQAHWLEALGTVRETAAYVWMPEDWEAIRMRLT